MTAVRRHEMAIAALWLSVALLVVSFSVGSWPLLAKRLYLAGTILWIGACGALTIYAAWRTWQAENATEGETDGRRAGSPDGR